VLDGASNMSCSHYFAPIKVIRSLGLSTVTSLDAHCETHHIPLAFCAEGETAVVSLLVSCFTIDLRLRAKRTGLGPAVAEDQ
jgi:hypothetical protein